MTGFQTVVVYGDSFLKSDTLNQVLEAAPKGIPNISRSEILKVLQALENASIPENEEIDLMAQPFFSCHLKSLTEQYIEMGGSTYVHPRWMSRVLKGLGINSRVRRNDGYVVMWTQQQLQIIHDYFEQ